MTFTFMPISSTRRSLAFLLATLPLGAHAQARTRKRVAPVAPEASADAAAYAGREDVMRFAEELIERHGFDPQWLQGALAQSHHLPVVARLMMPPPAGTAKNWALYRSRFVDTTRIRAGLAFWSDHERWLQLAEERYGVPPHIVVGIVGVETIYGQQTGGFRVIDALATLAFDFPAGRSDRSAFFRDELEQYLLLCRREGADPLVQRGSYAGAIGLPQVMPSSIVRFGIDFDEDGRVDLQANPADVIGSVAHYLAQFGWEQGLPTHFPVAAPVEVRDRAIMLVPDILPSFMPQQFVEHGASLPDAALALDGKLALIELQNGDAAPSYVAGTSNFYAITRYNWSSYYAMAVIELGEAVRQRRP
jgi:membrane-bound lytic murein transglycosylase B